MKKLILLCILCAPIIVNAQGIRHSRAYLGGVLQEGRFGGSLLLSYGINPYIGIGAGVDLLSYRRSSGEDAKFFAPFYADLRVKYPAKGVEPFVCGQFGKPAYDNKKVFYSGYGGTIQENGKYFYGIGGGLALKRGGSPGAFVSVVYRNYNFNATPDDIMVNGAKISADRTEGVVVFTAGIVF